MLPSLPESTRRRLRVLTWRTRRPLAALCAGLAVLLAVERLRPPDPPVVEVVVAARDLALGTELRAADLVRRAVPAALVPDGMRGAGPETTHGPGSDGARGVGDDGARDVLDDRVGDVHDDEVRDVRDDEAPAAGHDAVHDPESGRLRDPAAPGARSQDAELAALVGRRLAVPVPAGLVLVPELLVPVEAVPPAGTVVVPVRFGDAGVAAVLRPGTLVDVVAAGVHDGEEPARLARGATVLPTPARADTDTAGGGLLGGPAPAEDDAPVLLAVTPDESVRLGAAGSSRVLGAVIVG
jgi:Flp pilus assembly protein CpaB